jgi:1-phosphatidylinositol phosphodiesterase
MLLLQNNGKKMKRHKFIILFMVAVWAMLLIRTRTAYTAPEPSLGAHNWMRLLNDNVSLSQLSIPGTHNSGARYETWPGTAKCQDLSIDEQLESGVRFLDIRCCHRNNTFHVYHGMENQNLSFDDVLNSCISFLRSEPTECLMMSVAEGYKPSGNTRTFDVTFDSYIGQNPDMWYLAESLPNLQQVRGKIVLLRRFNAVNTPKGIDATPWPNNTTFWNKNGFARLRVQDHYRNPDSAAKWNSIWPILNEARSGSPEVLYLNFTSGYKPGLFRIPNIPAVSENVNSRLTTFFTSNTTGRFGVIVMDFVEPSLCSLIIDTNFDADAGPANGIKTNEFQAHKYLPFKCSCLLQIPCFKEVSLKLSL